jgi:cellulose synthase/poly-beta-1,6-N-acetylglucosamine synthase-like glycosyltransferase
VLSAVRPLLGAAGVAFEARSKARSMPAEIAFLASYGVPPARLIEAERLARQAGVSADRALLANGIIDETFFYQCLARHLGVAFIDDPVQLFDAAGTYQQATHAGLVLFKHPSGPTWLGAPHGTSLLTLMRNARRGKGLGSRLAITTPSLLSRWVQMSARRRIAADASFGLLSADTALCAHDGLSRSQRLFGLSAILIFCASFMSPVLSAGSVWPIITGLLFLAAVIFRLFVSAAAVGAEIPVSRKLDDHQLPSYTILVALYKEARVVKQLVRMLDQIDYPLAKIEIKIIIEEDDDETRRALTALSLSPIYEVILAPAGEPRTKPRALNVALPLARGDLITVFDAEDAPDSQQLRRAAERFAAAPFELACLQARLAIDNVEDNWLCRLFAIEYAALFHLQNPGLAELGLPLPLSGSSNHFRTSILRAIHGWDAWNVTEDADIGLRLARFGYSAGVLESTTCEEAPVSFDGWLKQRRRWYKGWFQTFVTLSRSPLDLTKQIGAGRSACLVLLLLGLLLGPLFWLPASFLAVNGLVQHGLQPPVDPAGFCNIVLWVSVSSLGCASLFWNALLGMKRQSLLHLWPVLLLLPFYYCLHTLAAWLALYELFWRPFHWDKTEHGLAGKTSNERALRPVLGRILR